MKVLVITRSSWRTDNSVGNTLENLFKNIEYSFDSISFRDNLSDNSVAKRCYHISEAQIIKWLLHKNKNIGKIEDVVKSKKIPVKQEIQIENKLKKYSEIFGFCLAPFAQEFLWGISPWKNDRLDMFLNEISPDIVFMPVFPAVYPHKVLQHVEEKTDAKVVLYHADDTYTLRQFNFNPLFWIYRFYLRKWVRNSVKISSLNYVISDIQKSEYEDIFHIKCNILYKGIDFSVSTQKDKSNAIKLVYTGNINLNRWKQLAEIAKEIESFNNVHFDIYTMTNLSNKMKKAFINLKNTKIKGAISAEKVKEVQDDADILVHVESFDIKNRMLVHQSFSTKIVDYLSRGKCILAIGPNDVASIDYLIKNDAAVVATSKDEISLKINELIMNKKLIDEYGEKAWECGKRNHNIEEIQRGLKLDFEELVNEGSTD